MERAPAAVRNGRPSSALELFHPAGSAPRARVLGDGCPPALLGALRAHDAAPADLVVVAPSEAQCRATGWLADAGRTAAAALADDGLAFLIAPPRWRRRLLAAARAAGLELGPTLLHLPDLSTSRHVVPVARSPVRYATECLLPRTSWKSRAASAAARLPGGERLVAAAAPASVVARRREGAPLLLWLSEAAGEDVRADSVVVTRTWRADEAAFTLAVVDQAATPRLVARVGSGPPAERQELGEERALAAFATSASEAGAAVPRVLASSRLDGAPVVLETGVPGRVAASLLAERPSEAGVVLERTLAWLLRWNLTTATESPLAPDYLEQEVLAPARVVSRAFAEGVDYLARLERLCGELAGGRATLTAAHDDLTMVNVLLRRDGGVGVVDWATARPAALPLVDFFYTVVDVHAASARYADRPRAFASCFSNGAQLGSVREQQERFERALGVERPVAELALHACWLHHAANELRRGDTNGPFLAIVRDLATRAEARP